MKKVIFHIAVFLLFPVIVLYGQSENGFYVKGTNLYYGDQLVTSIEYQKDADIIRLKHLQYYGKIITEYHEKTGKYPLQSSSAELTYVFVANSKQAEFAEDYDNAIPHKDKTVSFKKFIEELEKGLNREVDEFYDPQYFRDAKYNFYVYAVNKDVFYFAINVHQKFPFSKYISPYNFKVEISNIPNRSANLIILPEELFTSELFLNELNKEIKKEGFFRELEEKFLHETKKL
ncbi:MAG: hypothetical protein JW982_10445 [Spirochaetes bacterium]|nr:hypothetical protein [Spirochaetota bacterium]